MKHNIIFPPAVNKVYSNPNNGQTAGTALYTEQHQKLVTQNNSKQELHVKASCNERSGHHRVASTTETDKHSSNCCCASTKQNKQRKKSKNATSHALPPLILEASDCDDWILDFVAPIPHDCTVDAKSRDAETSESPVLPPRFRALFLAGAASGLATACEAFLDGCRCRFPAHERVQTSRRSNGPKVRPVNRQS